MMQQQAPPEQPVEQPSPAPAQDGSPNVSDNGTSPGREPDFREFDPRYKDPFTGLLYLGYLENEVELYGHRFRLCTPTQADRLKIGPVIKEYADTATGELAYQCALVAAYLTSVDGQPIAIPIFTSEQAPSVRDKFGWVIENLRRLIISELSDKCFELEDEVAETLKAMGKASGSPE